MVKEKLLDYPSESADPFMDAAVSGSRMHYSSPQELAIDEKRTIVYLSSEHGGRGSGSSYHLEVKGYRVNPTGIFKPFKDPKIRLVPLEEREEIENFFMDRKDISSKPAYITFQNF